MVYIIVILIGLVQGLAEFLPISSSGHLAVLYDIFGIESNTLLLSIIMHIATLAAVIIVYWNDILMLIKNPFCKTVKLLVTATIPTIIIVLIFEIILGDIFGEDMVIWGFLITAIVLLISDKASRNSSSYESDICNLNLSYANAIVIGIAQGIATIPGISRSGSTIATGMIVGASKEDATKFSFLMSIPIIIASFVYEILKGGFDLEFNSIQLFIGFIVAFISGLCAIKFMISYIKKKKLYIFSIYLLILVVILVLNKYVLYLW